MKKFLLFFVFLWFVFTTPASAHLFGQPPYFTVNGKYSALYPVQSNAIFSDLPIPQDLAVDTYLINQPIQFAMDVPQLEKVVPPDIVKITTFTWDFGDGTKGKGLENNHTYKKMGTYILSIDAAYTDENGNRVPPQVIQSVMLHALPNKDYTLPQAIITVNGKQINDMPSNPHDVNFSQNIVLDGFGSKAGSAKIVSYFWDFDNNESAKTATANVHYATNRQLASPTLRVKDANGFINDAYVLLKHNPKINNVATIKKVSPKTNYPLFAGIGFVVILFLISLLLFKKGIIRIILHKNSNTM